MSLWHTVGTVALAVTMLTPSHASADAPTATPERTWLRQAAQPKSSTSPVRQVAFGRWLAVAVLVGLSGLALWKGSRRRQSMPTLASSRIQLGSITRLTPKAQLAVVTVNGRCMLLAVTDTSVSRLMWLDEAAADEDSDFGLDPAELPIDSNSTNKLAAVRGATLGRAVPSTQSQPLPNRIGRAPQSAPKLPRQPSTFREILSDIIGIEPRIKHVATATVSPAETLALATEDRYVGRTARKAQIGSVPRQALTTERMVDCEGQAAGLIARLNRT
jgi:flagellar biogenesis protein FliO